MFTEEQVSKPLIFQYYTNVQKLWDIFAVSMNVISIQYIKQKVFV